MTSADFSLWRAYQRLAGPLGPERDDWRLAMVASVIANGQRDTKRRPRPYRPDEFIPDWAQAAGVRKPLPARETVEDKMKAFFQGLAKKGRS